MHPCQCSRQFTTKPLRVKQENPERITNIRLKDEWTKHARLDFAEYPSKRDEFGGIGEHCGAFLFCVIRVSYFVALLRCGLRVPERLIVLSGTLHRSCNFSCQNIIQYIQLARPLAASGVLMAGLRSSMAQTPRTAHVLTLSQFFFFLFGSTMLPITWFSSERTQLTPLEFC